MLNLDDDHLRHNVLEEVHAALGAEMTPWNQMVVPARYSSDIHKEHFAIRAKAGLTDMSGINKIWLSGKEAFEFLNCSVTRNCYQIESGAAVYTILLDNFGRVIDDAIVFHLDKQAKVTFDAEWLLCLGAGDGLRYFKEQSTENEINIRFDDDLVCLLLQGPKSCDILQTLLSSQKTSLPHRFHHKVVDIAGSCVLLSRTSYSGEDGFEIFVASGSAPLIWSLLVSGTATPVGFEALDIARIEAGLLFFGKEMTGNETPTELGLDRFCDCLGHSFRGKMAYLENKNSPKMKTVGLAFDQSISLLGNEQLSADGKVRGVIKSAARSEWLEKTIAIAQVDPAFAKDGQKFLVSGVTIKPESKVVANTCSRRFYNRFSSAVEI